MMYVGKINSSELLQKKSHYYFCMTACNLARPHQLCLSLNKGNVKNEPTQEMEL